MMMRSPGGMLVGSKVASAPRNTDAAASRKICIPVGSLGQMKSVAISDFANDTAGTVVVTKTGELKIDGGENGAAVWKQVKKMVALTRLDPQPNAFLIYRELGVYGQLGTVCEDQ